MSTQEAQLSISAQAAAIHAEALVTLAHLHMERQYGVDGIDYVSPAEDVLGRQVDIPKLRQGGVKCIWLSEGGPGEVTVDPTPIVPSLTEPNLRPATRTVFRGASEVQRMLRGYDAVRRLCLAHPNDLEFVTSAQAIREAVAQGKIAVLWHSESLLLANDLAMLRCYHALGLRACGLVHAAPLDWIDNDREQRNPGGLTEFGRAVIAEMNQLGIVIDLSHASEKAMHDVVSTSIQPVVVSHANPRRLAPMMRNLTDEVIRTIADKGGVIGIHVSSAFVDIACLHGRESGKSGPMYGSNHRLELIGQILTPGAIEPFRFEAEMRSRPSPRADAYFPVVGLERLIDHVDYLVNLAGIEHVGIGTDFQFLEDAVEGFDSVAKTPNVTEALLRRGYARDDILKILGENFLRVIETVIGD
jgi:membrane dipeptidase